jgi:hypothetical protein
MRFLLDENFPKWVASPLLGAEGRELFGNR